MTDNQEWLWLSIVAFNAVVNGVIALRQHYGHRAVRELHDCVDQVREHVAVIRDRTEYAAVAAANPPAPENAPRADSPYRAGSERSLATYPDKAGPPGGAGGRRPF